MMMMICFFPTNSANDFRSEFKISPQTDSELACEEEAKLTAEIHDGMTHDDDDDEDEIDFNQLPPPPGNLYDFN